MMPTTLRSVDIIKRWVFHNQIDGSFMDIYPCCFVDDPWVVPLFNE